MKTFTQSNLTALVSDLLIRIPQIEPFMFVNKLTVLDDEQYVKRFGQDAPKTALCSQNEFVFHGDFMAMTPVNKQRGAVLHEILHGAFGHLSDPYVDNTLTKKSFRQLANIAQNFVIENYVLEIGQIEDPNTPQLDRNILCNYPVNDQLLKYKGWSWRQVYDDLRANAQEMPSDGFDGHEFDGESGDSQGDERLWEAARNESETIVDNMKAAGAARGSGDIKIKKEKPIVPWQSTLAGLLQAVPDKTRKTWARVNRRVFATRHEYVPTLAGSRQALKRVRLLVDTSGSMYHLLDTAASDIMQLLHEVEVETLDLVYYDVGIQDRITVEKDDIKDYRITSMQGGGGTAVYPAFKELAEDVDYNDAVYIVLTDGYDDYTMRDLDIANLIWISYETPVRSNMGTSIVVPKKR